MKRIALGVLAATLGSAPALAATYTEPTLFLADLATAGLVDEDFENATFDGTTIAFGGGTISCVGTAFCPQAASLGHVVFGLTPIADDVTLSGVNAPYFSTPDTILFSFSTAITAFGINIGGVGDFGAQQTMTGSLSTGEMFTVVSNYAVQLENLDAVFTGNTLFFGITSATPFTTISFTGLTTTSLGNTVGDAIFFDDMSYTTVRTGGGAPGLDPEVIPLPASGILLLGGLAGVAALRRRRRG